MNIKMFETTSQNTWSRKKENSTISKLPSYHGCRSFLLPHKHLPENTSNIEKKNQPQQNMAPKNMFLLGGPGLLAGSMLNFGSVIFPTMPKHNPGLLGKTTLSLTETNTTPIWHEHQGKTKIATRWAPDPVISGLTTPINDVISGL